MPDQVTEQIQRITAKLKKAAENYNARLRKIETLEKENQQLRLNEAALTSEIKSLREQVFLLKASSDPLNPDDKKTFEKMLHEYISAVDNCIAKLKR